MCLFEPRRLVLILLVLQLRLPKAGAENATFTLESAIQYAIQNNIDLRILQQRNAAARAEISVQRGVNNPSFVGETTRSQPNYFLGLGYLFELGGKRQTRISIAQNEATVTDLTRAGAEKTLRHDVRVAFFQFLQLKDKVDQTSAARDLASRLLAISKERFEAGDVPKLEVLQAELELKRRENDLQESSNDLKVAEVHFNLLLNRAPQDAFILDGSLEQELNNVSLEPLLDKAVAERPEIKSVRTEILAQQQRLALARKSRIPDLQVEGGTEINDADFQYGYRFNVSFELPVFNQRGGEIASASATLESLKSEELSQRRKVESDVTESYLEFQTARFHVENYRDRLLPAVSELEQMSQESYHEGKTPIVSALDAQRNSFEVRREYLDALLAYQTALADLEMAAGVALP